MLEKNTNFLTELLEEKNPQSGDEFNSGSLNQSNKKLDKNLNIKSQHLQNCYVRGTQFLIQKEKILKTKNKKIEDGVYVSEGNVEVKVDNR